MALCALLWTIKLCRCPLRARALGFEAKTTEVVLTLLENELKEYNRKKGDEESWKKKDESGSGNGRRICSG